MPELAERQLRLRVERAGGQLKVKVSSLLDAFGFAALTAEATRAITALLSSERLLVKPVLDPRLGTDDDVSLEIKGPRLALTQAFESAGKAVGALAGFAVFVYLIGGLSILARTERLDLPPEVVIPAIPNQRLALLGLSQLLTTLLIGGMIAGLAFWLLPARSIDETWREWLDRMRRRGEQARQARKRDQISLIAGALLVLFLSLIAPLSVNGVLYVGILVGGSVWFVGHWRRISNPVVPVLVALILAGAATVLRQLEFPLPFQTARIGLTEAAAERLPQALPDDTLDARVIQTSSTEVILAYESPTQNLREEESGERLSPMVLTLPRTAVEWIDYELPNDPQSHSDALIELVLPDSWQVPLMCLPPTCEIDETADEEKQEGTLNLPFIL